MKIFLIEQYIGVNHSDYLVRICSSIEIAQSHIEKYLSDGGFRREENGTHPFYIVEKEVTDYFAK